MGWLGVGAVVFQSLMGFPMRCDYTAPNSRDPQDRSFNPLWVFQCAATLPLTNGTTLRSRLSIPYGFSNALRLAVDDRKRTMELDFQSLMGFPMRCDLPLKIFLMQPLHLSIPYGFSNALRQSGLTAAS